MTCEIRQIKHGGGRRERHLPRPERQRRRGKRRDTGYYARFRVIALFSAILYCTVIEEQSIEHARATCRCKKHPSLHHLRESAPGNRARRISRRFACCKFCRLGQELRRSNEISANRDNDRDIGRKSNRYVTDTLRCKCIEKICCQISLAFRSLGALSAVRRPEIYELITIPEQEIFLVGAETRAFGSRKI